MSVCDQPLAFQQSFFLIEAQNSGRDFADFSQRSDKCLVQDKMICPVVCSRVEKTYQPTRFPADRSEVASLVSITGLAGVGKIISSGQAFVLQADDVVNFAAEVCVFDLNQAVFAKVLSASDDQLSQFIADVSGHDFIYLRARILAILIRCSSCI